MGTRVLLVGEDNPYGSPPEYALFHEPRHASGNRLRLILGLSDVEYSLLSKMNLCDGKWSMREARAAAKRLREEPNGDRWPHVVVLLGRRVKNAFDLPDLKFFDAVYAHPVAISLPHPSGLNRLWNEPGAVRRARELLHKVAPDVPWGSSAT